MCFSMHYVRARRADVDRPRARRERSGDCRRIAARVISRRDSSCNLVILTSGDRWWTVVYEKSGEASGAKGTRGNLGSVEKKEE